MKKKTFSICDFSDLTFHISYVILKTQIEFGSATDLKPTFSKSFSRRSTSWTQLRSPGRSRPSAHQMASHCQIALEDNLPQIRCQSHGRISTQIVNQSSATVRVCIDSRRAGVKTVNRKRRSPRLHVLGQHAGLNNIPGDGRIGPDTW